MIDVWISMSERGMIYVTDGKRTWWPGMKGGQIELTIDGVFYRSGYIRDFEMPENTISKLLKRFSNVNEVPSPVISK